MFYHHRSRKAARGAGAGLLLLILAGCSSHESRKRARTQTLTVSAAISLEAPLDAIAQLYRQRHPGVRIRFNFGGSGTLEQQIAQGAPVDVFISASRREMDALAARGMIAAGSERDLVTNEIVLVVPPPSHLVSTFGDLARREVNRIAMAEPTSVPAGLYARQVLEHAALWDRIRPKLVFAANVRSVLIDVETANADAGLVYETEARLSTRVREVAVAPPGSHAPIVYPAAVIQSSPRGSLAGDFVRFLSGPEALEVFERYGFRAPP